MCYNYIKGIADTLWVENNNIVEYGSVAAFASNIDGEITVENGKKGVAYSQADEKYLVWEVKEGTVVFTSYLTNIAASRYDDDILIRSYAIAADVTLFNGIAGIVDFVNSFTLCYNCNLNIIMVMNGFGP